MDDAYSLSLIVMTFMSLTSLASARNWDYNDEGNSGPSNWHRYFPSCGGKSQSPINIDRSLVKFSASLTAFDMPGYETIPRGAHWQLHNNGHSVELQLSGDYKVKEGGLVDEFKAMRLDFHWGRDDKIGSEHRINDTTFPMELQIVHYNTKYGSYDEAVSRPDGLAIFAFLFRVSERDNPMYGQLINNLPNVAHAGDEVTLRPVPLLSLLPINLNNYYRYQGSMTTPPCSETIIWTVFQEHVDVSARQLNTFRTALYATSSSAPNKSRFGPNSRPVTAVNDRIVYSSSLDDATWWTAPLSPISITLAALLGFVILFLILGYTQRRQDDMACDDGGDLDDIDDGEQPAYDDYDLPDVDAHID